MTLAVREQVLAALYAKLDTTPPLTTLGAKVAAYRNRRKELLASALPALVMTDGGHAEPDASSTFASIYRLDVTIEGFVATVTEEALGPAISDLYAVALAAVMADPTLGGLAIDIHEGAMTVDLDRGEGKGPVGAFSLALTIEYWARQGQPYQIGP